MLTRRAREALLFFSMLSAAYAGFTEWGIGLRGPLHKGPPTCFGFTDWGVGLRGPLNDRPHPSARTSAPASHAPVRAPLAFATAIDLDGLATDVELPQGADLSAPLTLPPGTVEAELWLGGPLEITGDDAHETKIIEASMIRVIINDPDALDDGAPVAVELDVDALLAAPDQASQEALLESGDAASSR